MRTFILFSIFLLSLPTHAACKCNCKLADVSLCASSYDLNHPCGNLCPSTSSSPLATPMITACPQMQVINPVTGAKILINNCPDYSF